MPARGGGLAKYEWCANRVDWPNDTDSLETCIVLNLVDSYLPYSVSVRDSTLASPFRKPLLCISNVHPSSMGAVTRSHPAKHRAQAIVGLACTVAGIVDWIPMAGKHMPYDGSRRNNGCWCAVNSDSPPVHLGHFRSLCTTAQAALVRWVQLTLNLAVTESS